MKKYAGEVVSDDAFTKRDERWPEETLDTKEAYLIREIFDSKSFASFFFCENLWNA
jgi:asparagine synthase (glutamine-hydrolysing)